MRGTATRATTSWPASTCGLNETVMRKVDIFNHIYPPKYYERVMQVAPDYKDIGKRMRGIPMLVDLDVRFRVMDAFDEYEQVLSLPTPPIEIFARDADVAASVPGRRGRGLQDGRSFAV